jgi:hypothetical protein
MSELSDKIDEAERKYEECVVRINGLRETLERLRVMLQILRMKDKGYSDIEIGKQLGIRESAVRAMLTKGDNGGTQT